MPESGKEVDISPNLLNYGLHSFLTALDRLSGSIVASLVMDVRLTCMVPVRKYQDTHLSSIIQPFGIHRPLERLTSTT